MSAATVSALALVCLMVFFIVESRPSKKATISMLDLTEFKDLPSELRAMIKTLMPNGAALKKQWASISPQQKHAILQQISAQFPKTPQPDNRPPAPSFVIKPDPPPTPTPTPPTPTPTPTPTGLKSGFLLSDGVDKSQKKNAKNKKHDKVVTFSDIGASEDEEPLVSAEITDVTDIDTA